MTSPVFLDTSCFIYLIEDHPLFAAKVAPVFKRITDGKLEAITSVITVSEVLVAPIKQNNEGLIAKYHELFTQVDDLRVMAPSYQTAIVAARIAASYGTKLPDCYQLAIAAETGCSTFLTNDEALRKHKKANVLLIGDL